MALPSPLHQLLVLLMWCCLLAPTSPKQAPAWRRVEAVAGDEAVLPCHVARAEAGDRLYVVLWYRDSSVEPVYSYDNRPGRLASPEQRHTLRSRQLEGRATFRHSHQPALVIQPVHLHDQANYTCRADFRIASSRRTHLTLLVVVPPSPPQLRVEGELYPTGGLLGSLQEGGRLEVTCTVVGGVPRPALVWRRDDEILQVSHEAPAGGGEVQVSRLALPHLSRQYHNTRLSCEAHNNNVTEPLQASVTLAMNLRPLITRLVSPPVSLREGRRYTITCLAAGSRPHPNVTWTLSGDGGAPTLYLSAETQHGVNMSSSRVLVHASRSHHGRRLTCTALNPLFPDRPLSDAMLLNVTYPPVASLELGRGASSTVREGEDVYFNCRVDSNPPLYNISWLRQGEAVEHAPESGVLVAGRSLALRGVSREDAGRYVCVATNAEGEGSSPPLNLQVHYSPVCTEDKDASEVYTVGLGQPVNVSCHVKASPPQVKYSWIFNNSISSQRLPDEQVLSATEVGSVVEFVAGSQQDFGTLQCWAQNSVGRMARPCLYHVVPASRPQPPSSCAVVNKTYDSLVVACLAGSDGGLRQTFYARVYEAVTGRSQVNMSSPRPRFTLEGLTPGLDYVIRVSARNSLGHSPSVRLEAFTYKLAANTMKEEKVMEKKEEELLELPFPGLTMMVAMVVAVVVVIVVTAAALVVGRWCLRGDARQVPAAPRSREGYAPPGQPEDEDLPFEIPSIVIDSHRDLMDHDISDQAL